MPEPPIESGNPREDAALRAIVEGVEAETGERFFASLVRHVAASLKVRYAFVSELGTEGRMFRTLAVWGNGGPLENFEIPLAGTPCESVLLGELSHYPDRLQQRFPKDVGLAAWEAESYCGAPVLDPAGRVRGHVAIMHDQPMREGPRGLSILRIFAARVAAELERQRVERAIRESEERLARVLASAMDAIVTFDREGRVELWNEAAERVFGSPVAEVVGRPLDRFLSDPFRRALGDLVRGFSGGGAPGYVWAPGGLKARRADGTEFPVEATLSGVVVGERDLFTMILRDVDERRRAEEELGRLHRQNEYLRDEIRAVHHSDEIVGEEGGLARVLDQVRVVAETDATVLITGETGTGKELIARALHAQSRRRERPLIKVNCAALPAGLVESELFGHERGAFTGATERRIGRFELADRGTIFLDEIGDVPPDVQVKLLRVLQEQELERVGGTQTFRVDVRVIAATNRDLPQAVESGKLRRDLFYRLNVFPITLPPLRERLQDLPELVRYFVSRSCARIGKRVHRVPPGVIARLGAYDWPGNVRELENVIERLVILSSGDELEEPAGLLPAARVRPAPESRAGGVPGTLEEIERRHLLEVLEQTRWRIDGSRGAARILNLNPSTLRSRMKKLGIARRNDRS